MTLTELRRLIHLQLIEEASVIDLANRQLDHIAIVVRPGGAGPTLYAVSAIETEKYLGVHSPKVLGLAQAFKEHDAYYRLNRLYADKSVAAIVLLAAALEFWKSVLPDYSVSPAAQQVIKRYFEQNKDNPKLIELDADTNGKRTQPDFLKAAYLGPVGFDLDAAFAAGDSIIEKAIKLNNHAYDREDIIDHMKDTANDGFDRAYADVTKTRHSLDDLLKDEALEDLLLVLTKAIKKDGDDRVKALSWLVSHEKAVEDLVTDNLPDDKSWLQVIKPALDKLHFEM
jgi:hypothetical protein